MRKKTLFIVLCLLSGILTLGGCGKSETDDAKTQKSEAKEEDEWEETPVAPIEKEDLKKIGVPLKGTVEIKLENNTGKSITGFAVKNKTIIINTLNTIKLKCARTHNKKYYKYPIFFATFANHKCVRTHSIK